MIPFWCLGWGSVPPPGQSQAIIRHLWAFGSCFPICAFGYSNLQLIPLAALFLNDITFSISLTAQCPLPERCLPADLHHPDKLWIPWITGLHAICRSFKISAQSPGAICASPWGPNRVSNPRPCGWLVLSPSECLVPWRHCPSPKHPVQRVYTAVETLLSPYLDWVPGLGAWAPC